MGLDKAFHFETVQPALNMNVLRVERSIRQQGSEQLDIESVQFTIHQVSPPPVGNAGRSNASGASRLCCHSIPATTMTMTMSTREQSCLNSIHCCDEMLGFGMV